MSFPQGLDFRSTAGFLTDPANYEGLYSGHTAYPITSVQGNTVGVEGNIASFQQLRNRQSGDDARNGGTFFDSSGTENLKVRIDLPSIGNYRIGLSSGDGNYVIGTVVNIYDTATDLVSGLTGSTSAAQRFKDATAVERTNVTWPTSQQLIDRTMATTILRFAGSGGINSVYVEAGPVTDAILWAASLT